MGNLRRYGGRGSRYGVKRRILRGLEQSGVFMPEGRETGDDTECGDHGLSSNRLRYKQEGVGRWQLCRSLGNLEKR